MSQSTLPTEFGIFYPTGWIVAALAEKKSAEQVRRDLFAGGYSEDDCKLATADQVIPTAQGQLDDSSWLGRKQDADLVASTLITAHRSSQRCKESMLRHSQLFGSDPRLTVIHVVHTYALMGMQVQ